MFNSKGTTLKKYVYVCCIYKSSERAIFPNLHSKQTCVDKFEVKFKKKKVLKMVFFIKNRDNRVRCIDNSRILYPTEKYGWGLNDVLSK